MLCFPCSMVLTQDYWQFKLETVTQQLKMAKEEAERARADLVKKIEEQREAARG